MSTTRLKRACRQVEAELRSFLNELNQLQVLDYPSGTCESAIRDLRHKIQELLDRVTDFSSDPAASVEEKLDLLTVARSRMLDDLSPFLDWLRGAQTRRVPWSFIPAIERLGHRIAPGRKLLTYCANNYNYGIVWSQSGTRAPYTYCVVALPRLHRTNVLLHSLIGHELFHLRCDEFIRMHAAESLRSISQECWDLFSREQETGPVDGAQRQRVDQASERIHTAWARGLQELLCDMANTVLFGPASFFAMMAFSAFCQSDVIPSPKNNFYPPWGYRFGVVWNYAVSKEHLKKLALQISQCSSEIGECFEAEVDAFAESAQALTAEEVVNKHPFAKIAYAQIRRLLPQAQQFVNDSLPSGVGLWTEERVLHQVPVLLRRICHGVPPNEVLKITVNPKDQTHTRCSEPAELAAILNAGWAYETYWQKSVSTNGIDYDTISRLLLKACEDAERMSFPDQAVSETSTC